MHGPLVAQALVERGMLDSIAAAFTHAWYQVDAYIGEGRTTYLVIGAVVVLLFLMTRRRR